MKNDRKIETRKWRKRSKCWSDGLCGRMSCFGRRGHSKREKSHCLHMLYPDTFQGQTIHLHKNSASMVSAKTRNTTATISNGNIPRQINPKHFEHTLISYFFSFGNLKEALQVPCYPFHQPPNLSKIRMWSWRAQQRDRWANQQLAYRRADISRI